jgi:hypothetical protein
VFANERVPLLAHLFLLIPIPILRLLLWRRHRQFQFVIDIGAGPRSWPSRCLVACIIATAVAPESPLDVQGKSAPETYDHDAPRRLQFYHTPVFGPIKLCVDSAGPRRPHEGLPIFSIASVTRSYQAHAIPALLQR